MAEEFFSHFLSPANPLLTHGYPRTTDHGPRSTGSLMTETGFQDRFVTFHLPYEPFASLPDAVNHLIVLVPGGGFEPQTRGAMIRCSGAGIFWPRGAALMPSIAPGSIPSTTIEAEWPVALKSPMVEGWRIRRDHRKGGDHSGVEGFPIERSPVGQAPVGGVRPRGDPVRSRRSHVRAGPRPFRPQRADVRRTNARGGSVVAGGRLSARDGPAWAGFCSRGCSMGREPRLSSGSLRTGRQF